MPHRNTKNEPITSQADEEQKNEEDREKTAGGFPQQDEKAGEMAVTNLKKLEEELARYKKDAETYLDKLQWLAADFDNYRKRMEKNNQQTAFQMRREFLLDLLPIVDDIERGLAHANQGKNEAASTMCAGDIAHDAAKDSENDGTNENKTSRPSSQDSSLLQGLEMIYQNMMRFLENNGVTKIDCLYSRFDPYLHEAVMVEESQDHEDSTILEIFQNGYLLNKETLRPAMVKVSKKEV